MWVKQIEDERGITVDDLKSQAPMEEDIAAEEAHQAQMKKMLEACESEEDMCKILEEEYASLEMDSAISIIIIYWAANLNTLD